MTPTPEPRATSELVENADDPTCQCCRQIIGCDLLDEGLCENCYGYVVDRQLDAIDLQGPRIKKLETALAEARAVVEPFAAGPCTCGARSGYCASCAARAFMRKDGKL